MAAWVFAVGCSTPTEPGRRSTFDPPNPTLPLTAGPQYLQIVGFGISSDPQFPPCSPIALPRAGAGVTTALSMAAEGDWWVARSTSPASDIELRIRDGGSASDRCVGGRALNGTISGSGIDIAIGEIKAAVDVRALFAGSEPGGAAAVEGAACPQSIVLGRAIGAIHFSDSDGHTMTCPAVSLLLQPARF